MSDWIASNEAGIRLGAFLGALALMSVWEMLAPLRQLQFGKGYRWLNNLGLVVINTLVLRALFPAAAVGVAAFAAANGWGVLNYLAWPGWLTFVVAVVVLDMAIYLQHVMVHAIPVLWRLHRVHHADPDFDVTTGLRFHPFEIIISMLIKFAVIIMLGPPVVAVVVFEVLLNGMAMFNHANIALPKGVDTVLRWLIVTPDMHRVHHSVKDDETNSNFGFNLSLWDRVFGTYREQPRGGQLGMTIGIDGFNKPGEVVSLAGLMWLPFRRKIGNYAINRRTWEKNRE